MNEDKLLEELAALEHNQWVEWAKHLIDNNLVSTETANKWNPLLVPYEDLSDEDQEKDRVFARKIVSKLKELFE